MLLRQEDGDFSNLSKLKGTELSTEIARSLKELWDAVIKETGLIEHRIPLKIARVQFLVAQEAKEQSRKIIALTRWLAVLTGALLAFTVLLFLQGLGVFQHPGKNDNNTPHHEQQAYQVNQDSSIKNTRTIEKHPHKSRTK